MSEGCFENLGVSEGDTVICTEAYSALFTEGEAYPVQRHSTGYLYIVDDLGCGMQSTGSKFRIASNEDQDAPAETVSDREKGKVASDGGSTGYYQIPDHATELRHLISHKAMSKSRGDIFKACYRLGEKDGVDTLYDLNKMKFFIEDLIEMYERGEHI